MKANRIQLDKIRSRDYGLDRIQQNVFKAAFAVQELIKASQPKSKFEEGITYWGGKGNEEVVLSKNNNTYNTLKQKETDNFTFKYEFKDGIELVNRLNEKINKK